MTSSVDELIHREDLRPTCRIVAVHMVLHPEPQTALEISNTVHMNRRTVTNALNDLMAIGLVGKEMHGMWTGEAR